MLDVTELAKFYSMIIKNKNTDFIAEGHVILVLDSRLILAEKIYFNKKKGSYRIIMGKFILAIKDFLIVIGNIF